MPFDKSSCSLASTVIYLSLLLGYGRSQYTGNWTDFINTTFGGAAGDPLAYTVPHGTVFPRTVSLPRGIVTVSLRSLGALGLPSPCGSGAWGTMIVIFNWRAGRLPR